MKIVLNALNECWQNTNVWMSCFDHLQELAEVRSSEVSGRPQTSEETLVRDFLKVLLADVLNTQNRQNRNSMNSLAIAIISKSMDICNKIAVKLDTD